MEVEGVARRTVLGLTIALEGGLGLLALAVGWFLARPPLEQLTVHAVAAGQGLLGAVPLLAAAWWMFHWPIGPLRPMEKLVRDYVVPLFRNCTTWDLLLISAAAGIGEELLFRGVVQTGVVELSGSVMLGVIAGAVVFGLAHPITVTYVVLVGLIGIYLGWLQIATDNLLVPIVTHAAYDFFALVYLLRKSAGNSNAVGA